MAKWKYTLYLSDIKKEGSGVLDYPKAQAIADRIRSSRWFKDRDKDEYRDELGQAVEELEDVDNAEWFGHVMSAIYDEADYDNTCFIDTVSRVPWAAAS